MFDLSRYTRWPSDLPKYFILQFLQWASSTVPSRQIASSKYSTVYVRVSDSVECIHKRSCSLFLYHSRKVHSVIRIFPSLTRSLACIVWISLFNFSSCSFKSFARLFKVLIFSGRAWTLRLVSLLRFGLYGFVRAMKRFFFSLGISVFLSRS